MINYRNAWALVTGASSGIGMEFAWQLAKRGTNLILVARRANLLDALAGQVQETHGVRAVAIAADLALPDAPQALFNQVRALGVPVHILVNNAGVGVYGRLDETKLEDNQRMIMLNIQALLGLTHLFLPAMAEAREGCIFNIASVAAFQPVAYMSAYAATKAFVLSFSEALWAEYRARGVHVLAVCPGATETNFFNAMGAVLPIPGGMDTAENVVSGALSAIKNTARCSTITGSLLNHVLPQLSRILPRSIVASIAERAMRPRKNGS